MAMTDTTTATVTPQALAKAEADFAEAEAFLRSEDELHPRRDAMREQKLAALGLKRRAADEAQARRQTAPPLTPTERVAAITARRETGTALRAEDEGSPMSAALLDLAVEQSNALAAGQPVPGSFTGADVRKAAPSHWGDAEHTRFEAAYTRVGASHMEATMLHHAVRDSTPDPNLTPEGRDELWDSWWGGDFDANFTAFERVWNRLMPADRDALMAYRGSRGVVEAMVKLGKRLAGAR